MLKIKQFFVDMRANKTVRVAIWQLVCATISLSLGYLLYVLGDNATLSLFVTGSLIPTINAVVKFVNTTYFGDLGVKLQ